MLRTSNTSNRPPDLAERCQAELRRQWLENGSGPTWNLSYGSLERLLEVDGARLDLPDSWFKLLSLANRPNSLREGNLAEANITPEDFSEIAILTEELGEASPSTVQEPDVEKTQPEPVEHKRALNYSLPIAGMSFAAALILGFLYFRKETSGHLPRQSPVVAVVESKELQKRINSQNDQITAQKKQIAELQSAKLKTQSKSEADAKALKQTLVALHRSKSTLKGEHAPIIELSTHLKNFDRNAAAENVDDVLPFYSSVASTKPEFDWSGLHSQVSEILLYKVSKNSHLELIWKTDVEERVTKIQCEKELERGGTYLWQAGGSSAPFYVLSEKEHLRYEKDLDRLNERFGLNADSEKKGGAAKKHAMEAIGNLIRKG